MASALMCDRCKNFYARPCVPNLVVVQYHHGYGEVRVDLCDNCTKDLEKFLENQDVPQRHISNK